MAPSPSLPLSLPNANDYDTELLVAMVLSKSRRYQDVYLSYKTINSRATVEGFDRQLAILIRFQWVRVSKGEAEQLYLYFTAEGWCVSLIAGFEQLNYASHSRLSQVINEPGAHYARFCAFWLHPYLTDLVYDDDLLEQSVNNNFALICQSRMLWQIPVNKTLRHSARSYYLQTWPDIVLSTDAAPLVCFTKGNIDRRDVAIDFVLDRALFDPQITMLNFLTEPLDGQYLKHRQRYEKGRTSNVVSFTHLLDLFILQHIDPSKCAAEIESFHARLAGEYALSWRKLLGYLSFDDVAVWEVFEDIPRWLDSFGCSVINRSPAKFKSGGKRGGAKVARSNSVIAPTRLSIVWLKRIVH
ncbi:hypothetical protein [Vibrio salilacus]|uniref:hypothetical protein n=1 Tax=Vibrio salilacus TaxID=1323749 RepID=UPI000C299424|nr:hypothetical protein [Vibrio salilacus]